ncbi:hypothetical protein EUGRSUZ_H02956 [Eucalyptus grandis]|uniref:Uncharacterized protein n=2 Tax=Eucalyptus grandis TaxID=71139 RepID=A0ACC3JSK6_EUCGR|nr:hypothetical protein EUGRSUZ_H02956 [Eucalyptus grandis]
MAEAVLFSLATDILKTLTTEMVKPGGSASQKIQLLCCAKDELQSLDYTVRTIQAVLLDAEKQQWHNNQVKLWLKSLKDVLYDVQDLLDNVATEDLRQKVTPGNKMTKEVRLFFSKSNQLVYCLKVGNEIERLRKKLDRIERKGNFQLKKSEATFPTERRPPTFEREENIIGREKEKEDIIAHLLDSSSGERGMGKTMLANLVYRDEKVKKCFELRMWVCHGNPKTFDVDLIIKKILNSAKEGIANQSAEELQWRLRQVLDGKKYLLVLDDLWNEDRMRWLELQPLLMGEKSWDLFKKMAFGDAETSSESGLEEIGRDIVEKCAGVPLAIKTIGSLLYTKKKTKEWCNFKELELSNIDDLDEGIMEVLKVSYDYLPSHLKHCFAYCALFPKDHVFDKQTMIQLWMAQGFIESLEGSGDLEETGDNYVSNLLSRSFLEVEEIDDDTGEVNTFKMHDLMHDLALKVAGDECKMIDLDEGGIIGGIRHPSFPEQSSSQQKVTLLREATNLRTFLSLKEVEITPTDFPIEIISELRCCRALGFGYEYFLIPTFLGSRLKHLRFLDVSNNRFIQNLPDSITDLVNLQTLKLSNCWKLTTLPRDLKKLVNLRHLLIDGCESLSHMPCGLSHLSKLQTLNLYVVQKMDHKVPGGVGSLDELSALNRLGGSIVLKNLKFLQPVPNKGHLQEKERLRCLELDWRMDEQDGKSDSDELILWENLRPHLNLTSLTIYSYRNRSSPSWLSSMANLIELDVSVCTEWKYLPSLCELPSLRRLTLSNLYALEFVEEISDLEQSDTSPPYLPSLENLNLYYCDNLKGWWGRSQPMELDQDHQQYNSYSSFPKLLSMKIWMAVSTFIPLSKLERLSFDAVDLEHSMLETLLPFLRNLKTLVFHYCFELRSLSCGMQSLSSLQSLDIRECKELDVSSHDDEHGTQWRSLAKLRHLTFYRLPKLVALPEGIQHITTLESLDVSRCENLMSLPEWIGNFSTLQNLDVSYCSKLTCLPDGISRLTSLKTLRIAGCPVLQERCQRECGADWEKIAHLPCSREEIIEEW